MPISDCEVRDPRIRRTRQLLHGALHSLMAEKSFDDISVQDIAEAATVNRATFYDHYTDKFQLLEAAVAGGFHELLQERNISYEAARPEGVGAIVMALCDYLGRVHEGGNCQRQSAFQPMMDAALINAVRRTLLSGMPKSGSRRALSPEMSAAAAGGAICGAVKEWLAAPGHPPAKKIVQPVVDAVLPILHAAQAVGAEKRGRA